MSTISQYPGGKKAKAVNEAAWPDNEADTKVMHP